MEINIAVIPGDGIGPEITEATEQVLKRVCEIYGHVLNITHVKACSSSTKTNAFCLGIILCNVSRSFDYLIYPYYPAYTS